MKISTKGIYSLLIMTHIAIEKEDKPITVSLLSEKTNISEKYLEKLVSKLLKAKLLVSFRGANGGYKLARDAKEISVREIMGATEGNMKSVSCVDSDSNCGFSEKCLTASLWLGLNRVMNNYLENISLDDVVNKRINKK